MAVKHWPPAVSRKNLSLWAFCMGQEMTSHVESQKPSRTTTGSRNCGTTNKALANWSFLWRWENKAKPQMLKFTVGTNRKVSKVDRSVWFPWRMTQNSKRCRTSTMVGVPGKDVGGKERWRPLIWLAGSNCPNLDSPRYHYYQNPFRPFMNVIIF